MTSGKVLFAVVAGYVGIVLWWLAFGDSLEALAGLRARLRHRARHWTDRLAHTVNRRYLTRALAGVAIASLTAVAVVGAGAFGSKGEVGPAVALGPRSVDPASLQPSRALFPPAAAPPAGTGRSARVSANPSARVQRPSEKHAKVVVSLVRVSAHVTPAASTTLSTQGARSGGPAPLPAPAGNSAPSPLAAP